MKKFIPAFLILALGFTACQGNQESKDSKEGDKKDMKTEEKAEDKKSADKGAPELPSVPADARVFFANLENGDTVTSPVYVEFGIEGMEVEPAGKVNEGKGHHHVLINSDYTEAGKAVPADSTHIHYGDGSTSDSLNLPVGAHTLTMQFADGMHRSYGQQMSAQVAVMVAEEK